MPALPSVPKVLKVTSNFGYGKDQSCLNRYFLEYSGSAPTSAELLTFCQAADTAANSHLVPQATGAVTFLGHQAEDLTSATGAVAQSTASHTGSLGGHTLPAATAFMVQFIINRRYRGGKPKIFLPLGESESITTGDVWGASFLAAGETAWADYIAAVLAAVWSGGGTLSHVNVSYFTGFTVVTNPITGRARNVPNVRVTPLIDPVTAYAAETDIATQRRRNQV